MPSAILNDSAKVDIICALFDPQDKLNKICYNHPHTLAAYQSTVVAYQLFSILKDRLHAHIDRRVKHSQKLYWCLSWAGKNLSVVAAYMVMVAI